MEGPGWWQLWNAQKVLPRLGWGHARQKRRCVNDPCLFQLYLLWISNCIYAACLSIEMKVKRRNQSKAPSINNKHCFLFPLSFFVTAAVFTRVPFFDRKAKGPQELDRFCLLWFWSATATYSMKKPHEKIIFQVMRPLGVECYCVFCSRIIDSLKTFSLMDRVNICLICMIQKDVNQDSQCLSKIPMETFLLDTEPLTRSS